jgi:hypothetical protein
VLALYQRQTANPSGLGVYSAGFGGMYVPMPMDRFFWSRMDAFPDDPYGRAPFGAALTEVLRIVAFMQDLGLAWHRVGLPRYKVKLPLNECAAYAKDILGLTDPKEIDDQAQRMFADAINFFNNLNADDAFFLGTESGDADTIGSGREMGNVQQIFDIYRYRLIIALKQNPVLMGFVNGSTETWSDVQWEIYSKGMQAIVQKAATPLIRAAQLHLQLLGMPFKVKAEYEPIRSIQRLVDAQSEAVEIANEVEKVRQNWQTNVTAAQRITGSAPPSEQEMADDIPPKSEGSADAVLPGAPPAGDHMPEARLSPALVSVMSGIAEETVKKQLKAWTAKSRVRFEDAA